MVSPLLLIGDEGVGRRYSTLEAVKEIVAADRGGPECAELVQIRHGIHPDVVTVTAPLEKEIGVEPIRDVVTLSQTYPTASPFRFFIIDGADRMTTAAANAILKTLEEPPARSRFFLLAESYDRVLPTIRSRCGRVPYKRLPESFVLARIRNVESDADKALVLTRMGEGSIGRAMRYWGSNRLQLRDHIFNALKFGLNGDLSSAFGIFDEVDDKDDLPLGLKILRFIVHDVLVLPVDPERIINQDLGVDLRAMRNLADPTTWSKFSSELKRVQQLHESSYINLHFHLKTALLSVVLGG